MSSKPKLKDLSKFHRAMLLGSYGLNIPFMKHTLQGNPDLLYKAHAEFQDERPDLEKISIRTYSSDPKYSYHCPFQPFLQPGEALLTGLHLNRDYNVIFTEGIDPELTLICGNIILYPERLCVLPQLQMSDQPIALIEFIFGPGTVRDMRDREVNTICCPLYGHVLTWNRHTQMLYQTFINNISVQQILQQLLQKVRRFPYAYKHIVEWGYSSSKAGIKKENLIFWEVR